MKEDQLIKCENRNKMANFQPSNNFYQLQKMQQQCNKLKQKGILIYGYKQSGKSFITNKLCDIVMHYDMAQGTYSLSEQNNDGSKMQDSPVSITSIPHIINRGDISFIDGIFQLYNDQYNIIKSIFSYNSIFSHLQQIKFIIVIDFTYIHKNSSVDFFFQTLASFLELFSNIEQTQQIKQQIYQSCCLIINKVEKKKFQGNARQYILKKLKKLMQIQRVVKKDEELSLKIKQMIDHIIKLQKIECVYEGQENEQKSQQGLLTKLQKIKNWQFIDVSNECEQKKVIKISNKSYHQKNDDKKGQVKQFYRQQIEALIQQFISILQNDMMNFLQATSKNQNLQQNSPLFSSLSQFLKNKRLPISYPKQMSIKQTSKMSIFLLYHKIFKPYLPNQNNENKNEQPHTIQKQIQKYKFMLQCIKSIAVNKYQEEVIRRCQNLLLNSLKAYKRLFNIMRPQKQQSQLQLRFQTKMQYNLKANQYLILLLFGDNEEFEQSKMDFTVFKQTKEIIQFQLFLKNDLQKLNLAQEDKIKRWFNKNLFKVLQPLDDIKSLIYIGKAALLSQSILKKTSQSQSEKHEKTQQFNSRLKNNQQKGYFDYMMQISTQLFFRYGAYKNGLKMVKLISIPSCKGKYYSQYGRTKLNQLIKQNKKDQINNFFYQYRQFINQNSHHQYIKTTIIKQINDMKQICKDQYIHIKFNQLLNVSYQIRPLQQKRKQQQQVLQDCLIDKYDKVIKIIGQQIGNYQNIELKEWFRSLDEWQKGQQHAGNIQSHQQVPIFCNYNANKQNQDDRQSDNDQKSEDFNNRLPKQQMQPSKSNKIPLKDDLQQHILIKTVKLCYKEEQQNVSICLHVNKIDPLDQLKYQQIQRHIVKLQTFSNDLINAIQKYKDKQIFHNKMKALKEIWQRGITQEIQSLIAEQKQFIGQFLRQYSKRIAIYTHLLLRIEIQDLIPISTYFQQINKGQLKDLYQKFMIYHQRIKAILICYTYLKDHEKQKLINILKQFEKDGNYSQLIIKLKQIIKNKQHLQQYQSSNKSQYSLQRYIHNIQ